VLYPLFVFFSLDLLPEEIFGTEETPEYISSDSSLEAEDATPEKGERLGGWRRCSFASHIFFFAAGI
jgi:hypothetical protein